MAASPFPTTQYPSDQFVESCGAILFNLSPSPKQVCLLHHLPKNEWLLAKGRRNCAESRHDAALREVREETGFPCRLYPVTMKTRAPAATEAAHVSDQPRTYPGLTEPFMVTVREMQGKGVKFIWWFIAEVDHDALIGVGGGEIEFSAQFLDCDEALSRLTFKQDRDVLSRAISIVESQHES